MRRWLVQAREWFLALERRERWLVGAAGVLLLGTLLYLAGIEPFLQSKAALEARVARREADLAWMRQALQEVRALRGRGNTVQSLDGSLLGTVDASAREQGLAGAIRTLQQENDGRAVRLRLEGAAFDGVLAWIHALRSRYGITVDNISVEPGQQPGTVNVSLTLRQP